MSVTLIRKKKKPKKPEELVLAHGGEIPRDTILPLISAVWARQNDKVARYLNGLMRLASSEGELEEFKFLISVVMLRGV